MRTLCRFKNHNLTIFSRLMLGNLTVLAIATAVSVYAILQLGHMRGVTRRIILVQNVLINRYNGMTGDLLSEIRYEKKFSLFQDPALYQGFLAARSDFEKDLKKAMNLADSSAVKNTLEQVRKLSMEYQSSVEVEFAARLADRPVPEKVSGRDKDKAANKAIEKLAHLKGISQKNILHRIKKLDGAVARARTVAMVITVAALLFGMALSFLITRSIIVPLSLMKKKTGEIAEGVFEADLDLSSPPEIGALAGAFNSMCTKLREVDRMKSDFYALMSHELRTPLTSIREGTNMFLEGLGDEVSERQQELLTIIAEESTRLIDLVNSLMELSKLQAGVLPINLSRTEFPPLIARSLREVAPLAAAKNITIESDIAELSPASVDAEKILQVLRNLIGNALKFTPSGGTVRITARRGGEEVHISVADTGPGIPAEEIDTVFEKFHQASSVPSPRVQGTGLGLAIVRNIVQAHGGRVWAESEVGQGCTLTFALPV